MILQVVHAAGAGETLVVDPLAHRREAASRLGAARVGTSVDDIADWTAGEGRPLVFEATSASTRHRRSSGYWRRMRPAISRC